MLYLLDTNIFVEAKNRYYGFDICKGFWDWLDQANKDRNIASISFIREELIAGNDELATWAEKRKQADWFIPVDDEATQRLFADISNHVNSADFKPTAKADFLGGADPWLIAKARQLKKATVVTHEALNEQTKKKVPIPNICREFKVPYINTFELLRKHSANFILDNT